MFLVHLFQVTLLMSELSWIAEFRVRTVCWCNRTLHHEVSINSGYAVALEVCRFRNRQQARQETHYRNR